MKNIMAWLLVTVFGIGTTIESLPRPPHKVAQVTLRFVDSFGNPQEGCRVVEFSSMDDDAKVDYSKSFDGLVGEKIPYGNRYKVFVKCLGEKSRVATVVSVGRPEEFIVLSEWLHLGDYVTHERISISVQSKSGKQLSNDVWVKLVGIYLDNSELDRIDPQSHSAKFYDIPPGRYIVLVMDGEKLACTKQIDFLEAGARLDISLMEHGCKVEEASSVRVID
jgi:hypothetical protein